MSAFMATPEAGSPAQPQPDHWLPMRIAASVTSVTRHRSTRASSDGVNDSQFPTELLPPDIADLVEAVARVGRVPEALPGCCALAAVSASIGRGLSVRSASHRTTGANLFIVVGARSGAGKSECFGPVIEPVFEFQRRVIDDWKANTRPKLLAAKLVAEARIGKLRTLAATSQDPDELQALAKELTTMITSKEKVDARLNYPLLVCEDVTSERLAVLLGHNHETLFSASSDAGSVLNNLLGRYCRVGRTDENLYLKGYSGDSCRVDRVGREPVVLTQPCLSVLWLVQPDKLDTMFGERSLSEGGLLPRVMVCQADAEPVKINRALEVIHLDVRLHWQQLLFDLLETYHQHQGMPHVLIPAEEAIVLLDQHQNQVVERRRGELADMDAYAARWAEWTWRLTVVLHAAKHQGDAHNHQVEPETAIAAIRLANWFADQQLALLEMSRAAAKSRREEAVLDLLRLRSKKKWPKNAVNARDIQRARIALTPTEASALLDQMAKDGKVVVKEYRPPSGGHNVLYYSKKSRRS